MPNIHRSFYLLLFEKVSGHKTIVSSPQSTMQNRHDKPVTENPAIKKNIRKTNSRIDTQIEPIKEKRDESPLASLLIPKPVKQRLNFSTDKPQINSQQLKSCHSSVHSVYSSISTSSSSNHSNKSVSTNHISSSHHEPSLVKPENLNLKTKTDCLSPSNSEKPNRVLTQSGSKNNNKEASSKQQPVQTNRQNVTSPSSAFQNVLSKEYDLNKRKYLVGLNLFNRLVNLLKSFRKSIFCSKSFFVLYLENLKRESII